MNKAESVTVGPNVLHKTKDNRTYLNGHLITSPTMTYDMLKEVLEDSFDAGAFYRREAEEEERIEDSYLDGY